MSGGIIDNLLSIDNTKRFKVDMINGLPVVNNGRIVIKSNNESLENNLNQNSDIFLLKEDTDETISTVLESIKTKTIVIGVGGAGNNAISRLQETGISGAITLAVNTDAQDLFYANADQKLLIGKSITAGLGAGNDPKIGERSAESDLDRIKKIVAEKNIVFITCGLGGGTGTGAAPIIAREAKSAGALVITFCTLPFKMEGEVKRIIAYKGLSRLSKYSDTIIPIPNENLLKLVPDITLMKGFRIMDEILIRSVKSIVDLVSNCGLIHLDLADVRSVLTKQEDGTGYIGLSEISLEKLNLDNKEETKKILRQKTLKALNNPLLENDPSKIVSCLVSIMGNQNLTLSQVNEIMSTVSNSISPRAKVKMGAMIDPKFTSIKVSIIGLGQKSPYLVQAEHIENDQPLSTIAKFAI